MSNHKDPVIDKQSGILALIVRPFWMFLGNFILLISAAGILAGEDKHSIVPDVILWGTTIALIAARFFDVKFLDGQTATGKPATIGVWLRYAIVLVVLSAVIWSAARCGAWLLR